HIKPKLDIINEARKEFPNISYILGGTADIPRDIKPFFDNKVTRWFDKALWDRLQTGLKTDSIADAYLKYKQGLLTPDQFIQHVNNINTFFGGIPSLKLINPTVWGIMRLTFLAPDWEISLLKQFGNAITLKDEQSIRFYYNVLAFNTYFNALLGAFRGVQPVTSSVGQIYDSIKHGDLGRLFSQMYSIAGHPMSVDVLGYEKEMPTLIYDTISVPMTLLGSTGDIGTSLKTVLRDISNKFAPYPQMISSLTNYINNKPNSGSQLLAAWLPFIFKPSLTGDTMQEGLVRGVIGSTGARVYKRKLEAPIAELWTGRPNVTPSALQKILADIQQQYNTYQTATGTTDNRIIMSQWANLYGNILDRVNPDTIPRLTNILTRYKKAVASNNPKAIQQANQDLANTARAVLQKLYNTISYSTLGRMHTPEQNKQMAINILMFAYHEAKSKSSRQVKLSP
ncbi:MAG: hypothetical protein QXI16_00800, partial [Sulfolobaceae archaeon]